MSVRCFIVEVDADRVWKRLDTGEEFFSLAGVPAGAMWYADWMLGYEQTRTAFAGPDGRCLVVKLPNGHDWMIDAICSNCTDREGALKGDHKCWVRHGTAPNITVDKNGKTCGAGGGSILSGTYHGFLRNGELVEA
jgi:hypothetical protein